MKTKLLLTLSLIILSAFCISCQKNDNNDITENPMQNEVADNTDAEGGKNEESTPTNQNSNTEINQNPTGENTEKGDTVKDAENNESPETVENPEVDTTKDTYFVDGSADDLGFEVVGELESSEYVIFTVDGEKFGIRDIASNVIVEPSFTILGWCPWHEVVYAEPFPEGTEPIVISDKYKIDVHYGHGSFGKGFYVFDSNTQSMFSASADIEVFYLDKVDTIPYDTPYRIYNGSTPLEDGEYYPGTDKEETYYALEKLIFTGGECEYVTSRGSVVKLGECEVANGFINDYMMVKRQGKIGFVDLAGNNACEFIYTDAMNAFDSKAWVKTEDGIWKVVNLK